MKKMIVFTTKRLQVRLAEIEDATFLYEIWNLPEVMKFVGFPKGLQISFDDVVKLLKKEIKSSSFFDRVLMIEDAQKNRVGNCKLGSADREGIAHTDVKVHPRYWGMKYGQEVKQGLVNYHFTNTDCRIVKADPNRNNIASIKMQELVGAKRIKEFVYEFPESMRHFTEPVCGYIYYLYREDWLKK